jgi:hypothetical protein
MDKISKSSSSKAGQSRSNKTDSAGWILFIVTAALDALMIYIRLSFGFGSNATISLDLASVFLYLFILTGLAALFTIIGLVAHNVSRFHKLVLAGLFAVAAYALLSVFSN